MQPIQHRLKELFGSSSEDEEYEYRAGTSKSDLQRGVQTRHANAASVDAGTLREDSEMTVTESEVRKVSLFSDIETRDWVTSHAGVCYQLVVHVACFACEAYAPPGRSIFIRA